MAFAALAATVSIGGCPRPEDRFEPNDTFLTATMLTVGEPVEGRVLQGNQDVFAFAAGPGTTLRIRMDSVGEEEEECAAFRLDAPDGRVLYDDATRSCSRGLDEPVRAPGASLTRMTGIGYELVAPADVSGLYVLTLTETGHADNIFTYSWQYRITVTEE